MEVPKDFAEQVEALSSSTPREAIANLLSALLPRVAARTRPPMPTPSPMRDKAAEYRALYSAPAMPTPYDPMSKLTRTARRPRTRMPRHREYRVLRPLAFASHRRNTWTRAMVESIVTTYNEDKKTNAAQAENRLRDNYPQYADRTLDFAWCVEKGYITFSLEGE